jgi:hypothetical protein
MTDMGMGNMRGKNISGSSNMRGMEMGGGSGTNMEKMPTMDMGNPPEHVKRARMLGPNASGQPGPRTSAEFTEPDMGDMKAPLSENVWPNLGPQVVSIAETPTDGSQVRGKGFLPAGACSPTPTSAPSIVAPIHGRRIAISSSI